ncbi:hypothetical protein CFN78_13990 [Amycolatopsis antarctica]|uniref:Uncharacterized protein n=1 Tax=Amycolatopsis antarctica TaxID=1854586 RepID=A0A263D447_9PSEU|nr:hypothetical protein CFN78_13990 [Amycolatopsis antarctica]
MATAIAAAATGGGIVVAGTATATTTHQAESCTSTVNGNIGDPVTVRAESLRDLVKRGAQEAGTLALADIAAHDVTRDGALAVGQVPNAQNGLVSGNSIADAAAGALKGSLGLGLNSSKTISSIKNKIAGSCGISVVASDYEAPESEQPIPQQPAPGGNNGGTGPQPGTGNLPDPLPSGSTGSGDTTVPQRSYDNIPVVPPGIPAPPPGNRYPGAAPVPGMQAPEVGVLGAPGQQQGQPVSGDVRNAGNADSLAAPEAPGTVQMPMLLAVIALAGVSAALVRTWVVRKAT